MTDFSIVAGQTAVLEFGPVKRAGVALDLTAGGTLIRFVAKLSDAEPDAAAEIDLSIGSGVTVEPADHSSATVTIASTKTVGMDDVTLHYELWLTEPSGQKTPLDRGYLKVAEAVLANP